MKSADSSFSNNTVSHASLFLSLTLSLSGRLRKTGRRRRSDSWSDPPFTSTSAPRGHRLKLSSKWRIEVHLFMIHSVSITQCIPFADIIYFSTHLKPEYIFLFKQFSLFLIFCWLIRLERDLGRKNAVDDSFKAVERCWFIDQNSDLKCLIFERLFVIFPIF